MATAFLRPSGTPGIGLLKFCAFLLLIQAWSMLLARHATRVLTVVAITSLATVAWNVLPLASL